MKRSNVIGILAAAAVIVLSVVLISWYLTKRTPTLIQGTVECTTYKASSKVPGRIDDMKVAQGDRVEKGQLLYTLSTPELEAKLRQAEAVKSAAAALDAMALAGARVQQIEAAMNMWQKAQAGLELARKTYERVQNLYNDGVVPAQKLDEATANYKAPARRTRRPPRPASARPKGLSARWSRTSATRWSIRPSRARSRRSSPRRANWSAAAIRWWPSST